jgi:hypothetical protein
LIFGGCSHSIFYSDLHILDLQTMEWSQPHVQGDVVTPRAGHAGITIDENWYIVGGGDNSTGCLETLVLNMSKLVWSTSTHVEARHPLASEVDTSKTRTQSYMFLFRVFLCVVWFNCRVSVYVQHQYLERTS